MYSDIKAKKKRWSLPQRSAACAVVQHMKAEAGFVLSRPQAKMRPPAALLPPAISGPGCKVQAGAALPWPLPIPLPGRKVLVLSFLLFNCTCTYVYFPIKGIVVYVKHHSWLKKCPLPTFLSEVLPFFFFQQADAGFYSSSCCYTARPLHDGTTQALWKEESSCIKACCWSTKFTLHRSNGINF